MATIKQVKRRRNIQMAEGYLDLAMVLNDELSLDLKLKMSLATRAIECLENIKNPLGHKPHVLFLKGQAAKASQRLPRAVNFFMQSLKLDPDNLHAYLAVAWCYKRLGRLDQAIDAVSRAVELDSDCAIAQYNLACYYALNRQVDLAIMHLSFALDLNSRYRELVITESDFDTIRANPRFASLASVNV
ncbi:MAG: tetratricopeptide repeat protein [Mariniblastus sp.]|nr:tetratricopeptide repeat protein [Mariniblastus sp.]